MRDEEIETIDIEREFMGRSRENNVLLYHADDTHWNAQGEKLAVDLTENFFIETMATEGGCKI
ncbi:MAG: hypothetical protein JW847_09915 [Candidatus Omnitrophica bacterium]|nr:hypothetical protein [Candidatus Omnitrophota bacterium]